jgi:hypothetical protein
MGGGRQEEVYFEIGKKTLKFRPVLLLINSYGLEKKALSFSRIEKSTTVVTITITMR